MRTTTTLATLATAALVSACSHSYTPQEQRFLDDMQKRSSFSTNPDPDGDLTKGRVVCDTLTQAKPDARNSVAYYLSTRPDFGFPIVYAAQDDLCPEVSTRPK